MIHRTRDGKIPDGGPEPGRSIVRIGNVFVEYSGPVPDQAELDAHRNPTAAPQLTVDDLAGKLVAKGALTQKDVSDILAAKVK